MHDLPTSLPAPKGVIINLELSEFIKLKSIINKNELEFIEIIEL